MPVVMIDRDIQLKIAAGAENIVPKIPAKVKEDDANFFFVATRVFDGAHYYSETVSDIAEAYKMFRKYCGVVQYFGGGAVELFCVNSDGYYTIESRTY